MRDLELLITANQIHDYLRSAWKTDTFRASHDRHEFVYEAVEAFAKLPRIFAKASNPHLENSHFSTWWNVITLREYDNPAIHDLYILHEIFHAAHMPYVVGIGMEAFHEKMQRNELEASVHSEIEVYLAEPMFRSDTFPHPIYADRFIASPSWVRFYEMNKPVALETIRTIRRDVMVSKPIAAMDDMEMWIRRFADQNHQFNDVWAARYQEIETRMSVFQRAALIKIGRAHV